MLIYTEMEAAMRADDADRYAALLAEDFEYVRHKSRDTIDRDAMREPAERRSGVPAIAPSRTCAASMRTTTSLSSI
jgi:hypothetical protein